MHQPTFEPLVKIVSPDQEQDFVLLTPLRILGREGIVLNLVDERVEQLFPVLATVREDHGFELAK